MPLSEHGRTIASPQAPRELRRIIGQSKLNRMLKLAPIVGKMLELDARKGEIISRHCTPAKQYAQEWPVSSPADLRAYGRSFEGPHYRNFEARALPPETIAALFAISTERDALERRAAEITGEHAGEETRALNLLFASRIMRLGGDAQGEQLSAILHSIDGLGQQAAKTMISSLHAVAEGKRQEAYVQLLSMLGSSRSAEQFSDNAAMMVRSINEDGWRSGEKTGTEICVKNMMARIDLSRIRLNIYGILGKMQNDSPAGYYMTADCNANELLSLLGSLSEVERIDAFSDATFRARYASGRMPVSGSLDELHNSVIGCAHFFATCANLLIPRNHKPSSPAEFMRAFTPADLARAILSISNGEGAEQARRAANVFVLTEMEKMRADSQFARQEMLRCGMDGGLVDFLMDFDAAIAPLLGKAQPQ